MDDLTPQSFENGEIHKWYRLVLGFSDHLVAGLLNEFELEPGDSVLDPFCGSGTTLVECMKRGINSWGIDANPSSCFAARVKTTWNLRPSVLRQALQRVIRNYSYWNKTGLEPGDAFARYLRTSGMLDRGWIGETALKRMRVLRRAICGLTMAQKYKDALLLVATTLLVRDASKVKFGPELYCVDRRVVFEPLPLFSECIEQLIDDLSKTRGITRGTAIVFHGDSRQVNRHLLDAPRRGFQAIICSPPYPTEHDYTRNSRLELAFLDFVRDRDSLRTVKKQMVRSHTKGVYEEDTDSSEVLKFPSIDRLVARVDRKARLKEYGFARLYSRVVREYFGGMSRHFACVQKLLAPGGRAAYVVGDQASYFQIPVRTARILAEIAETRNLRVIEIRKWRRKFSTTSGKYLAENILILQKPAKSRVNSANGQAQKNLRPRESSRSSK
jgi:DNA methylase